MMAAAMKTLLDLPKKIAQRLPTGTRGVTVLSIDDQWLKLLHAAGPANHRSITHLMAYPVEGKSDEEILRWLKETCASSGFEPAEVLIANPSHLTTSRLFALPSTDAAEIRDIVGLQVEKHTPYAKEDILTDFRIIENDRSGYSRVLLVISHKDVVHRGLKMVEAMGWPLEHVGFELEGLVNCLPAAGENAPEGGVLLAQLNSDTTTLVILQGEKPYFHRSFPLGIRQLRSNPEEGQAKLVAEFQRSLETFEAEGFNLTVSEVVLTGPKGTLPDLKTGVQQGLSLPTRWMDPFEGCSLADPEMLERPELQDVSFASLLGLVFRPGQIDLTPQALRLHRAFEVRAKALVGLGCQAVGVLLLFTCLVIGKAQKDDRYHGELLHQHEIFQRESKGLESHLLQLGLIQHWLDSGSQLLETMVQLNKETPPVIRWKLLTFKKGEGVVLKGISEETPKVFDFAQALEKSLLFSEVKARNVTKKKIQDKDVTEFEIVCSTISEEEPSGEEPNLSR